MKKIFAIALALVMVLSMASAFAYEWDCPTKKLNTGKMTIEVVPYVKVNSDCDPYWQYAESTCAGAVASTYVHYAVKVTVPTNLDQEWYDAITAAITLEAKGVVGAGKYTAPGLAATFVDGSVKTVAGFADDDEDGWVLYLAPDMKSWVDSEATGFAVKNVIFNSEVTEWKKTEICAYFTSEFSGLNKAIEVGGYSITFTPDGEKNFKVAITDECGTGYAFFETCDGKIMDTHAAADANNNTCNCSSLDFYKKATSYFNLGMGTCLTKDNIKANFGWKEKVQSCFKWSGNAQSVVDAECVVAIPKTGDASVLAWLF